MDMKEVGVAYTAATLSAVGIAVGLTRLVPRLTMVSAATRSILGRFVPFVSVASAGCVNVSFMRWKEIRDGVSLFKRDIHGDKVKVGDSPVAGRRAVAMTAASRVMTNSECRVVYSEITHSRSLLLFSTNNDTTTTRPRLPTKAENSPAKRPMVKSSRLDTDWCQSFRLPTTSHCRLSSNGCDRCVQSRVDLPKYKGRQRSARHHLRVQQGPVVGDRHTRQKRGEEMQEMYCILIEVCVTIKWWYAEFPYSSPVDDVRMLQSPFG